MAAGGAPAAARGTVGSRPRVSAETPVAATGSGPGAPLLDDGPDVSAETSRPPWALRRRRSRRAASAFPRKRLSAPSALPRPAPRGRPAAFPRKRAAASPATAPLVVMRHDRRRRRPRRRPPDPHRLAGPTPGARPPRPRLPLPRLRPHALRSPSRPALGRRRRDQARQPRSPLPPASPGRARGGLHRRAAAGRRAALPSSRRQSARRRAAAPAGAHGAAGLPHGPMGVGGHSLDVEASVPSWDGARVELGWAVDFLRQSSLGA